MYLQVIRVHHIALEFQDMVVQDTVVQDTVVQDTAVQDTRSRVEDMRRAATASRMELPTEKINSL